MNSRSCAPRFWFVLIGRNSRSMNSVRDFRHLFSGPLQGSCCNLDSCSNFELCANSSCSSCTTTCSIGVIAPPQVEVPPVSVYELLLRFTERKIHKQSSSSNHRPEDFLVHPDSFSAELSRPADTTQPRIRATILGTLHLPRRRQSQRAPITVAQPTQRYHGTATIMKSYDFVSQHAVNRFLEPFMRSALRP